MSARWEELAWPVTTPRLLLRPGTLEDVATTWRYRRLPEVARWITAEPRDIAEYARVFGSPERLAATLVVELVEPDDSLPQTEDLPQPGGLPQTEDLPQPGGEAALAGGEPSVPEGAQARTVGEPARPRVIGDLKFAVTDAWAQLELQDQARGVEAELGWAFDPAFHGRGYATEAVRAALGIAFDSLGLRRVYADCFAANEPSWRLMERIGMRRETYSVGDGLHRSGEWMDGMVYAMLATEWREAHRA